MSFYEYSAVPAPLRSDKPKGSRNPTERYATTLTETINQMAADGWEYLRAETLPSEERSGLTGRTTIFHNILIFRRETAVGRKQSVHARHMQDRANPAPVVVTPPPAPTPAKEISVKETTAKTADNPKPEPAVAKATPKDPDSPAVDQDTGKRPPASEPTQSKPGLATASPVFSEKMRPAEKQKKPRAKTSGKRVNS
ncbi:MAG: DUF4177 domain-containing protein [Paracoccus sp. (in: a-proteobacteria)]